MQDARHSTRTSDGERGPLLSAVMPAYNEEPVVGEILRRVARVPVEKEIIAVDDCSTDGTLKEILRFAAENPRGSLKVIRRDRNEGKTAAVRDGIAAASGEVVVIQDADLEYDPGEFPRLLEPILAGRAEAVYGSRFTGALAPGSGLLGRLHRLVNKSLTFLSNLTTGMHLSDMETCYKLIRRDILGRVEIESSGFGFEVEITAKLAHMRAKVIELPISYRRRRYRAGKKIGVWDGLAALWWIARFALD